MISRQIRVSGRVQGVGYRDWLRREAERRGVRGWVRNRTDGTVEAVLQGKEEEVAALIAWARRGPPAAHVQEVSASPAEPEYDRPYAGFARWPSA